MEQIEIAKRKILMHSRVKAMETRELHASRAIVCEVVLVDESRIEFDLTIPQTYGREQYILIAYQSILALLGDSETFDDDHQAN